METRMSTKLDKQPRQWECRGYITILVLEELEGRKWDDFTEAFVHTLRPSSVRILHGGSKMDSQLWRVSVNLDENGIIQNISQEVEVGLPEGVENGGELMRILRETK